MRAVVADGLPQRGYGIADAAHEKESEVVYEIRPVFE